MPNPLTERISRMSDLEVAQLYKTVFSTPDGQLCLQDIKNRSYRDAPVAIDTVTKTLVGHEQLYLNAGMQLLCLHIEGQIEYQLDPQKEQNDD